MDANDNPQPAHPTRPGSISHDSTSVKSSAKTSVTESITENNSIQSDAAGRNPVELLADEFAARLRAGECPTIEEYVLRCPEQEKEIRLIFPSIESVERISTKEADHRKNERESTRFFQAKIEEISDFEITRELGRGGMGIVYEAVQKSLNRKVALKTINPLIANSPQQLKRFQREAEAAAKLQHTNIIQIFGVGEENGIHYFAMQLVEGCSLAQLIGETRLDKTAKVPLTVATDPDSRQESNSRKDSSIQRDTASQGSVSPIHTSDQDEAQTSSTALEGESDTQEFRELSYHEYVRWVCRIIADVANALEYAHSNGVYHRDIKPANILIDKNGTVLISDFGLAKFSDFDELTQAGDLVGTLRYMAPEQFEGIIDQRTDIYSLGLALFELLALQPAFDGTKKTNAITISEKKLTIPKLRGIDNRIPIDLETITAKATAPDPIHRFQSAGEFQEELQRFLNGESIKSRPVTWLENAWRWSKRNPAIAALSTLSILLLVAVAIVGIVGNWQTTQALAGMKSEYERAENQKDRAHENLSIAKEAIKKLLNNLSQRGVFQQKSYRFGEEEFVGTSARLSQADIDMLQILLDVFQKFSQANEEDLSLDTAEANSTIGDIYQKMGRYNDAVQAYQTAFEQYSEFNQSAPSDDSLLAQLRILNEMAVASGLNGDRRSAERSFHLADKFHRQHKSQLDSAKGKFEYARSLNVFASTGTRVNQFAFARPRRRPSGFGFPPNSFFQPGRRPPGFAEPRDGRRGGMDGGKGVRGGGGGKGGRPGWSGKDWNNGPRKGKEPGRGGPGSFLQYVSANQKAETILEDLIQLEPDNVQYKLALARNLSDRMRLIRFGRSANELENSLEKVKSSLRQLIDENPDMPAFQFELAETLMNNVYTSSTAAKQQIEEAVTVARRLSEKFPDVYEYRAQHADAMAKAARIDIRNSATRESAMSDWGVVLKTYEEITAAQPDALQFQLSFVLHLCNHADMLEKNRQLEVAKQQREKALSILNRTELSSHSNSPAGRIKSELVHKLDRTYRSKPNPR